MNFKLARFLYVVINFILGAFFFIAGFFAILLPWSEFLQNATIHFIMEKSLILSLFGWGFVLIGLSVIINAYISSKRRLAYIKSGGHAVALNENLIEQYLEAYWKEHFPHLQIPFFLTIKKRSLLIEVDLPYMALKDQNLFLEKVQNDFNEIFAGLLGYPHEVDLIASFKPQSNVV